MQPTLSHPDRAASTLANVADEAAARGAGPFAQPGPGARDCRMDLKLLTARARRACEVSARARERLAEFAPDLRPDLWAGTVRDGTARGFAAALEEAIALAPEARLAGNGGAARHAAVLEGAEFDAAELAQRRVLTGKQLRRTKDLLVASGKARVRFSRRHGLLYVERQDEVHSANCLRFEARRDHGTLDEFRPDPDERPRLFSAQFLTPQLYEAGHRFTRLELAGRLGRGPVGWQTELSIRGDEARDTLELTLTLREPTPDWRLRIRFLGIPTEHLHHDCEDVREVVANDAGGFVAFTLVRACGTLLLDGERVAVPAAQTSGPLRHSFRIGPGVGQ
ncbi:MAG: hypothetical protein NXI31_16725 [bacterium]|nr:hypothetical protein [bacterium]